MMIVANISTAYVLSYRRFQKNFFKENNNSESFSTLMKEVWPLFIGLFLLNLMSNISKYVMDFMCDVETTGIYNILFIVLFVINLLSGFIFKPSLYRFGELIQKKRITEYRKLLVNQIIIILGLAVFIAVGAYLFGTSLFSFVYSIDMSAYGKELFFICLGGGALAIASMLYYQMTIVRKQKDIALGYAAGVLVEAILSIFFVKRLGMFGGIIAVIISYILLGLYLYLRLEQELKSISVIDIEKNSTGRIYRE